MPLGDWLNPSSQPELLWLAQSLGAWLQIHVSSGTVFIVSLSLLFSAKSCFAGIPWVES